ncbi:hypothetical protein [Thermococcus henrietii]|uniref:hypothetical protein n=1 Tax=Thermococcus henrietii TaxID=2016361 RepID=UPI000C08D60B|nr:hypothetical protein [Thermococcus henrietii]
MKVIKIIPIIFLLLSPSVSAFTPPSWFKNGTYVTYAIFPGKEMYRGYSNSFAYIPSELPRRNWNALIEALQSSNSKGCLNFTREIDGGNYTSCLWPLEVYGPMFLTFRITNVTNTSAVVEVVLVVENVSPHLGCTLSRLTFEGTLLLNITSGYYYINGTKLGPPSFFVVPYELPGKKTLLFRSSLFRRYGILCNDIYVRNVSFDDKKSVNTFVRKFYPPLIRVASTSSPFRYSKCGYLSTSLNMDITYDFDTGIAIGTTLSGFWPELYALGIMSADVFNYHSAEINKKLDTSREFWPYGFVLYKTNVKFPREETGKAPDTVLKYYLILGLLLLTASALWGWRR